MTDAVAGPQQTARGSSRLDPESQETYRGLFGVRYLHVQQQPAVPSRAQRRGGRARGRRR